MTPSGSVSPPALVDVFDAIQRRRSIKRFTDRAVTRDEIERLLNAAVAAPNHRLTQPWRFYVLGPDAREAYGRALGERKALKLEDAEKGRALRDSVAREHRALPGMIVVAVIGNENPEIHAEDVSAAMMAVQNIALAAVAMGLGTHIKTGAVMRDPAARAAAGVRDDEEIIAIVNVGEPAEAAATKSREPATALTVWMA